MFFDFPPCAPLPQMITGIILCGQRTQDAKFFVGSNPRTPFLFRFPSDPIGLRTGERGMENRPIFSRPCVPGASETPEQAEAILAAIQAAEALNPTPKARALQGPATACSQTASPPTLCASTEGGGGNWGCHLSRKGCLPNGLYINPPPFSLRKHRGGSPWGCPGHSSMFAHAFPTMAQALRGCA